MDMEWPSELIVLLMCSQFSFSASLNVVKDIISISEEVGHAHVSAYICIESITKQASSGA